MGKGKSVEAGDIFSHWRVLKYAGIKYGKLSFWECECSCGTIREVSSSSLKIGKSRSCGCVDWREPANELAPFKRKYSATRHGAIKRGFSFEITLDEYIEISTKSCRYCGEVPHTKVYAYTRRRYTKGIDADVFVVMASIDRIDSSGGYTKDNCAPCCVMCNRMKTDLDESEFLDKVSKIYEHRRET